MAGFYEVRMTWQDIGIGTIVEQVGETTVLQQVRMVVNGVFKYAQIPFDYLAPIEPPPQWLGDDATQAGMGQLATPLLTAEEMAVLDKLAEAWNLFVDLPFQHPAHNQEFMHAIHAAQHLVMSRPVSRHYGWPQLLVNG